MGRLRKTRNKAFLWYALGFTHDTLSSDPKVLESNKFCIVGWILKNLEENASGHGWYHDINVATMEQVCVVVWWIMRWNSKQLGAKCSWNAPCWTQQMENLSPQNLLTERKLPSQHIWLSHLGVGIWVGILWKYADLHSSGHCHASLQSWTTQHGLLSIDYRRWGPGEKSFMTLSVSVWWLLCSEELAQTQHIHQKLYCHYWQ
jgi:hypothetical protein